MRTFVLFANSKDVTGRSWMIATTEAEDFAGAAKNLGGEVVVGDALIYGADGLMLVGYGEMRIFEPGACTFEVLAKAVAADECADVPTEAGAIDRYRYVIDLQSIGLVLATAPAVPSVLRS